jgi:hypothetical protein
MTNDPNPAIDPLTGQPLDQPDPGYMILYDAITPPLPDGVYMATATTEVDYDGSDASQGDGRLTPQQRYFAIDGPRFTLPADLVASVVPPRNGHGGFADMLPHIALGRKTLPWERDPGLPRPSDHTANPSSMSAGAPPLTDLPVPWVALLLFEDGECTIKQSQPLSTYLPQDVLAALKVDGSTTADFVVAKHSLVASIVPSVEELKLLTHCRQVNVDYKELSAGSSDGYFSVVMSNRLPEQSKKYLACLVSVEQRWDLVPTDPPESSDVSWSVSPVMAPVAHGVASQTTVATSEAAAAPVLPAGPGAGPAAPHTFSLAPHEQVARLGGFALGQPEGQVEMARVGGTEPMTVGAVHQVPPTVLDYDVGLILLTSWKFECSDLGTFHDLMQAVDVAMIGTVADPLHPPITDTGHLPVELHDRAGVVEHVLYRGPLVPMQLSRDDQGPYHSADQARRVMPDTGVEDISYAAAFEVGRLLAMSDGRLAQELMRWRRTAFRQAVRASLTAHLPAEVRAALPAGPVEQLQSPLMPIVQSRVITSVATSGVPAANAYGLPPVSAAPGLDPTQLAAAWGMSASEAQAALGRSASILGAGAGPVPSVPTGPGPISAAQGTAHLDQLAEHDAGIAALRGFQQRSGVAQPTGPKE